MDALVQQGAQVWMLGSAMHTDAAWTEPARVAARQSGLQACEVYQRSLVSRVQHLGGRVVRKLTGHRPVLVEGLPEVPGEMPAWFAAWIKRVEPDVILVNYAAFASLLPGTLPAGTLTVVDSHDLMSLNVALRAKTLAAIQQCLADPQDPILTDLKDWEPGPTGIGAWELAGYERFNRSLFITERDTELVRAAATHTRPHFLPFTIEASAETGNCEGAALFVAGDNPFNSLALELLLRRIQPAVSRRQPDFRLQVAGRVKKVTDIQSPAVVQLGAVPEVAPLYRSSRFFVNSVFTGTGQQIKISEAMAHGLPVVAFQTAAAASPLVHGESGLVANTPEEMVEHILTLWNNPRQCRELGQNAREAIRTHARRYGQEYIWNLFK